MLTRRALIGSTSGLMSLLVIGGGISNVSAAEDVAARLARDLNAALRPGSRTALLVVSVTPSTGIGVEVLKAVVEMHWPPGTRRRPIEGVGADDEEAYQVLLARTLDTFRSPNPDAFV